MLKIPATTLGVACALALGSMASAEDARPIPPNITPQPVANPVSRGDAIADIVAATFPAPTENDRPRTILSQSGGMLVDNGDTDGSDGYSNTQDIFGARRTLLDDFEIPADQTWRIEDFHHIHLWDFLEPGVGTGLDMKIWSDSKGAPGAPLLDMVQTAYEEQGTGRVFFNRNEAMSWTCFEPVDLGPGRYWFEATIIGPDLNFWLVTQAVNGSECWLNYDDLEFGPGSILTPNPPYDLSWIISGQILGAAVGACCTIDSCVEGVSEDACQNDIGGTYLGDGSQCNAPGDANGDGGVDFADVLLVLSNWNTAGPEGDVNCDGAVNFSDILMILANWG